MTPTISAKHNVYLLEDAPSTHCVMLVGKGYLTYAITNEKYDTVYLLNHFVSGHKAFTKNDLHTILSIEEVKKADQIIVALDSYKNTLVPYDLYRSENKEDYLLFLEDKYADEEIHTQNITNSLVEIFTVKSGTQVLLRGMLNNPSILSASAVLLRNYPSLIDNKQEHQLFISVKEGMVVITHYHKGMLQLHQQYAYGQALDIVYFICNIISIVGLEASDCCIYLHGEHDAVTKLHTLLCNHFNHVKYCPRIPGIQYPDHLYSLPTHYFYNLFSIFACAL